MRESEYTANWRLFQIQSILLPTSSLVWWVYLRHYCEPNFRISMKYKLFIFSCDFRALQQTEATWESYCTPSELLLKKMGHSSIPSTFPFTGPHASSDNQLLFHIRNNAPNGNQLQFQQSNQLLFHIHCKYNQLATLTLLITVRTRYWGWPDR